METLVDKFLATVTDEFGNKIDFSNVESEGFEGNILINNKQGSIYIYNNAYGLLDDNFNEEEKEITSAFIKYVQQKMKEHKAFLQDDINTKNDLYNYGKF